MITLKQEWLIFTDSSSLLAAKFILFAEAFICFPDTLLPPSDMIPQISLVTLQKHLTEYN